MSYLLLFALLECASPIVIADDAYGFGTDYSYDRELAPSGLSLSVVEKEVEKLKSIEDFLRWTKTNYPEHLRHFSFVRNSGSLQGASDSHPRAIVYGPDARFIFAFNGDPDHKGYQKLELIQFHEPDKDSPVGTSLEFREITFSADGPKISPPNPAKCLRCHSTQAHHLWEPYEDWKGAYGRRDDGILDKKDKYVFGGQTDDVKAEYDEEHIAYQTFLSHRAEHPRYRELLYPEGSKVTPYSPSHRGDYRFRPNLLLTDRITKLQAKLLAGRLLDKNSCFSDYGEMALARLLECEKQSNLEERMRVDHVAASALLAKKYPLDATRVRWLSFAGYEWRHPTVTYLRLLGVELEDWSPQFKPKYWGYFEGEHYLHSAVAKHLFSALRERGLKISTSLPIEESCEALVSAHEAKARNEKNCLPAAENFPERPPTVKMCASCHEENEPRVPQFNFESPAMKQKILARIAANAGEKAMPPERPLSEREREEIRRYLR